LNWSERIRQIHRWTSIVFTVTVLINFIAAAMGIQSVPIGLSALFPLFVLLFSGLYLFALPYLVKRRRDAKS
jgi:hypothetical protein